MESTALRDTVLSLLDGDTAPWASIYMPVRRPWNEEKANRLQFRNLLEQVQDRAPEPGLAPTDVESMLAPVVDLPEEASFWEGDLDGIALFLARDDHTTLRLPFAPSPVAVIDERIHVRPLWRHLEPDGPFFVLGLSAGGAALFRASRYEIQEVALEGPTTLDEVLQFDEHERSLQFHTGTSSGSGEGGGRSAMFFGHEDAGDKRYVKEGLLRFFRTLDNQVRDVLEEVPTPPPLVLVGIEQLRGLYRQVNRYAHLLDESVEESVIDFETREWDVEALHRRAWTLVRPQFAEDRQEALDRFHAAPDHTAGNPGSVFLAATEGRVDTLFVAEAPRVWGTFDDDRHAVRQHSDRQAGDTELLNGAAARTLQSGGTVYVTDAADVPEGGPIAALLRY